MPRDFMECGGKRSATPLWLLFVSHASPNQLLRPKRRRASLAAALHMALTDTLIAPVESFALQFYAGRHLSPALGVQRVIDNEFARENVMIAQAKRAETESDPAQSFTGRVRLRWAQGEKATRMTTRSEGQCMKCPLLCPW